MTGRTVLTVNQVTKRFGGLTAVNDVSFDVKEHEVLGLIGPNGSGKTTMMNLFSGALPVTSGEIRMDGKLISGQPPQQINRMGISRTFQLVRLLPSLSVVDNVIAGSAFGHSRKWGRQAADHAMEMLERVGMSAKVDLPVSSLTYIDQKRLELARGLASDPAVLLLDEWLAGLNPTELQEGIQLIKDIRDEGRTIILVEHVMDAIRSLCDTCVVMNSGNKIAEGTTVDVLGDKEVIRAYLGEDDA